MQCDRVAAPSVRANRPGLFREIVFVPTPLRRISSGPNVKSAIVIKTIKLVYELFGNQKNRKVNESRVYDSDKYVENALIRCRYSSIFVRFNSD